MTLTQTRLELSFSLTGRPVSTKNSRVLAQGRSFMNKAARARLEDMRRQLRAQYRGEPRTECFDMTITVYYANRAGWLDSDNAASFIGDLIKGLIVLDDKPRHLRDWTCKPRLSRNKEDRVEIVLVEVQP